MLGEQLTVPEVKFVTHTLSTPAIPVDLILDVGNTHTCGVIIEVMVMPTTARVRRLNFRYDLLVSRSS